MYFKIYTEKAVETYSPDIRELLGHSNRSFFYMVTRRGKQVKRVVLNITKSSSQAVYCVFEISADCYRKLMRSCNSLVDVFNKNLEYRCKYHNSKGDMCRGAEVVIIEDDIQQQTNEDRTDYLRCDGSVVDSYVVPGSPVIREWTTGGSSRFGELDVDVAAINASPFAEYVPIVRQSNASEWNDFLSRMSRNIEEEEQ